MTTAIAAPAASAFDWKRFPETEAFVGDQIARALAGNSFASHLAERMRKETSTRFGDWVDHLVLSGHAGLEQELSKLAYAREGGHGALGAAVFAHQGGMFPRIVVVPPRAGAEVRPSAIKVESVADFSRAHDLGLEIVGYPLGPYRHATIAGEVTALGIVERRGYLGFEPFPGELAKAGRMAPHAARDAMAAKDLWKGRQRRFDDDEAGFDVTEATLARVIDLAGSPDLACHLIFEAEREYWQSRNRAARGAEGSPRPPGPGMGESRSPHLPLLPAVLSARDRYL